MIHGNMKKCIAITLLMVIPVGAIESGIEGGVVPEPTVTSLILKEINARVANVSQEDLESEIRRGIAKLSAASIALGVGIYNQIGQSQAQAWLESDKLAAKLNQSDNEWRQKNNQRHEKIEQENAQLIENLTSIAKSHALMAKNLTSISESLETLSGRNAEKLKLSIQNNTK